MPVGKDHDGIGMDFAVLQPRHPVVHAAGQIADFRMQRAAEGNIHFLQAAADAEQRDAAGDAGFRQGQRHVVAMEVVGFVLGVGRGLEARRVNIGARAGQHDAVDHIQKRRNIGDVGGARKHQWQGARHLGDGAKVSFANHLDVKAIFDAIGIPDHTDYRLPSHALPSLNRFHSR